MATDRTREVALINYSAAPLDFYVLFVDLIREFCCLFQTLQKVKRRLRNIDKDIVYPGKYTFYCQENANMFVKKLHFQLLKIIGRLRFK